YRRGRQATRAEPASGSRTVRHPVADRRPASCRRARQARLHGRRPHRAADDRGLRPGPGAVASAAATRGPGRKARQRRRNRVRAIRVHARQGHGPARPPAQRPWHDQARCAAARREPRTPGQSAPSHGSARDLLAGQALERARCGFRGGSPQCTIAPPVPSMPSMESQKNYKNFWNEKAATPDSAFIAVDGSTNEETARLTGAYSGHQVTAALDLKPTDRVLELGCGVGRIGREIAPHVAHWEGTDISANMIEVARERLHEHSNVGFTELTRSSLQPLADASFDKAYCVAV